MKRWRCTEDVFGQCRASAAMSVHLIPPSEFATEVLPANPFDFGVRANFVKVRSCAARLPPAACTAHLRASPFQIFGKHPILWLLPTNQGIEGNGIFYELSVESQAGPGEKLW